MAREGEPGRPGERGLPGTPDMGGTGGTGGSGGKGGTAEGSRSMIAVIIFVCIVAVALSLVSFSLVEGQNDAIDRANQGAKKANQAIVEGRKADYRLCVRQMVNRAVIDSMRARDRDDHVKYLPLFDCSPDLTGGIPKRLTAAQSIDFRRQVMNTPSDRLP